MENWAYAAVRAELSPQPRPVHWSVREGIPTDAHARAEEHSDNCTQAAGSQFGCVHDLMFVAEASNRATSSGLRTTGRRRGSRVATTSSARSRRSVSFPVLRMDPPDVDQQRAIGDLPRAVRRRT